MATATVQGRVCLGVVGNTGSLEFGAFAVRRVSHRRPATSPVLSATVCARAGRARGSQERGCFLWGGPRLCFWGRCPSLSGTPKARILSSGPSSKIEVRRAAFPTEFRRRQDPSDTALQEDVDGRSGRSVCSSLCRTLSQSSVA